MCGRFALSLARPEDITSAVHHTATWIDAEQASSYAPRRVVNPTTYAPVAFVPPSDLSEAAIGFDKQEHRDVLEKVIVRFMRWGLIPSFAQQSQISKQGALLINARGETVLQKPSFRAISAKSGSRRCVVVTTGYYEWFTYPDAPGPPRGRSSAKKLPYLIHQASQNVPDGSEDTPLLLAGIYDVWQGVLDRGEKKAPRRYEDCTWSFTIMTMAAADDISWLHDRMPVCLTTNESVRIWLDSSQPPELACKLAFQASQRSGTLSCTGMVKDLSAPVPPSEQGRPTSPLKAAAIDSFFSCKGKSGKTDHLVAASQPCLKEENDVEPLFRDDVTGEGIDIVRERHKTEDAESEVQSPRKRPRSNVTTAHDLSDDDNTEAEKNGSSVKIADHSQEESKFETGNVANADASSLDEKWGQAVLSSPVPKNRVRERTPHASPSKPPRSKKPKTSNGNRSITDYFCKL